MEGAPVLEPIEHSVLAKPLDGDPMKEMSVLEPLEHSVLLTAWNGGPMEGAPVLVPIEHSVLEKPLDGGPLVPGESCADTQDYIKPTWLAGSPVCAWTVTGSLLFGSPHRRIQGCFRATLLSLLRFDGLARVVACWERYLLEHNRSEFSRCKEYLIPPRTLVWIVLVSRSSEMDQAGPSSASSGPLPGTFLGLALDMRSDKLYDLVPDIPDVMGLRALRPTAAIMKVMSVPDSHCIRVVTPDDHVNIGFHEVLLHDMEDEDLPFVTLSELDCLRRIWTKTLFVFVSRYQDDLDQMRKECRERFGSTQSGNCLHCGKYIQQNLGKHVALYHIELAQL